MVTYFRNDFCAIIGEGVDILFCNEKEAIDFTQTQSLAEAQEKMKDYARTFVITQGSQGALIYNGHEFSHVPAFQVHVVDTVGAGDIFAGAFLHAIGEGFSYLDAGNLASFAASKVVSKFGPRLDEHEIVAVREMFTSQAIYA